MVSTSGNSGIRGVHYLISMKNKNISVLLSLLLPGLGHFYIGKYIDGLVFLVGAVILWLALFYRSSYFMTFDKFTSFLVWGALAFVYLYSLADAYRKTV